MAFKCDKFTLRQEWLDMKNDIKKRIYISIVELLYIVSCYKLQLVIAWGTFVFIPL